MRAIVNRRSNFCWPNDRLASICRIEGLALRFAQADARSSAIFFDELNSGLFEGSPYILEGARIRCPCSAFKVRNSLCCCFACLRKI